MPAPAINDLATKAGISQAEAEKKWDEAKKAAKDQYPNLGEEDDRFWAIVMGIFKNMVGIKESTKPSLYTVMEMEIAGIPRIMSVSELVKLAEQNMDDEEDKKEKDKEEMKEEEDKKEDDKEEEKKDKEEVKEQDEESDDKIVISVDTDDDDDDVEMDMDGDGMTEEELEKKDMEDEKKDKEEMKEEEDKKEDDKEEEKKDKEEVKEQDEPNSCVAGLMANPEFMADLDPESRQAEAMKLCVVKEHISNKKKKIR